MAAPGWNWAEAQDLLDYGPVHFVDGYCSWDPEDVKMGCTVPDLSSPRAAGTLLEMLPDGVSIDRIEGGWRVEEPSRWQEWEDGRRERVWRQHRGAYLGEAIAKALISMWEAT